MYTHILFKIYPVSSRSHFNRFLKLLLGGLNSFFLLTDSFPQFTVFCLQSVVRLSQSLIFSAKRSVPR